MTVNGEPCVCIVEAARVAAWWMGGVFVLSRLQELDHADTEKTIRKNMCSHIDIWTLSRYLYLYKLMKLMSAPITHTIPGACVWCAENKCFHSEKQHER